MAVVSAQVSVTSSVTPIATQDHDGQTVTVRNADATLTVFIGGSDTTISTGYGLTPGAVITRDLGPGEALYGIATATPVSVHVLRTRKD